MTRRQLDDAGRWIVNAIFWPCGWLEENLGAWAAILWAIFAVSAIPVAAAIATTAAVMRPQ